MFFPARGPGTSRRGGRRNSVIGVVCALRPEKGLSTLVEAFAAISQQHPGVKLAIVGSGPCLPELQEQARAAQIADRCVFVSKTNEVARWLRAIDIFVLPSLTEALSNALMEAMACGCCAVASRVGGNPELLGASERGVLFESRNAAELAGILGELIRDPDRRRFLAETGKSFIHERFSGPASIARMQEIYTLVNLGIAAK